MRDVGGELFVETVSGLWSGSPAKSDVVVVLRVKWELYPPKAEVSGCDSEPVFEGLKASSAWRNSACCRLRRRLKKNIRPTIIAKAPANVLL